MLLGCCICDRPAMIASSGSGGSTGGGGSDGGSDFSGSVSSDLACAACASGVLPVRLSITWSYSGTGDANHPCCSKYDGIGPITVFYDSVTVVGTGQSREVRCTYKSTDTLGFSIKPPFDPRRCDPSLNPIAEFYFHTTTGIDLQPVNGSDVYGRARIRYAEDVVGGQDCIYEQVIGTVPYNCLSSFSLTKVSDWTPNGPCVTESIPSSVSVSPA